MGETPDQIERHIYEKRNELGENISELQQKVKTAMDWRAQFEQRPIMMMGLAFGGGLLASMLFTGRRESRRSNKWSGRRWRRESQRSDYGAQRRTLDSQSKADAAWENIRSAVLAVAGSRLGTLIEEVLPGFIDQYKKTQQERSSTTSRPNGPETPWRRTASGETNYMPQS
jgi:hypothetical protein